MRCPADITLVEMTEPDKPPFENDPRCVSCCIKKGESITGVLRCAELSHMCNGCLAAVFFFFLIATLPGRISLFFVSLSLYAFF